MKKMSALLSLGASGVVRFRTGHTREKWADRASKKALKKPGCMASAICVLQVDDKPQLLMLTAHSRGGGTVEWGNRKPPSSSEPVFDARCAPTSNNVWYRRHRDAEFLLLNSIANQLLPDMRKGSAIAGYIAMHVEFPPCRSCERVINLFRHLFRNVKLQVSWERPSPLTNFDWDKTPRCSELGQKACQDFLLATHKPCTSRN